MLKPCPFCGHAEAEFSFNGEWENYNIHCTECHSGIGAGTPERAVLKWETRASPVASVCEMRMDWDSLDDDVELPAGWRDEEDEEEDENAVIA